MKKSITPGTKSISLLFCATVLPLLFGCVAEPGRRGMRAERPTSTYVQSGVLLEDDYVYYPGYEVYYSNRGHNYVYQDGHNWVTRDAPPRVRVDVLLASPSVRVDFHDAPAQHHPNMVRQYPKNWKPAERNRDAKANDHKDDGRPAKDDDSRKRN